MEIGYNSEYNFLESVYLNIPYKEELTIESAEEAMYSEIPNHDIVLNELDDYIKLLKSFNIKIYTNDNTPNYIYYPNSIYARDVAAITHDSVIIGNMKYDIRKGEELNYIKFLRLNEYHNGLIEFFDNKVTFEGADLLRTGINEFTIAIGNRTHENVATTLEQLYPEMTINRVKARPEGIPQHLLGAHLIVDKDLMIVREELTENTFGYKRIIKLKETDEVKNKYATNILVIAPSVIIMPDDCPETQKIYESYGITCHTSPMSEIRKMSGGFACMTNILKRKMI